MENSSQEINLATFIGRITRKPEFKDFSDGKSRLEFSLATNEKYTNGRGERKTDTQFHKMVLWGSNAIMGFHCLEKGTKIKVLGKLSNKSWIDKAGIRRISTEVNIKEFTILENFQQLVNEVEGNEFLAA
jgi:single-strand DNA-binding protein